MLLNIRPLWFKVINDSLGTSAVDAVLREGRCRLGRAVRLSQDWVARYGRAHRICRSVYDVDRRVVAQAVARRIEALLHRLDGHRRTST